MTKDEEILNAIDPNATMFPSGMQARYVLKAMEEAREDERKRLEALTEEQILEVLKKHEFEVGDGHGALYDTWFPKIAKDICQLTTKNKQG